MKVIGIIPARMAASRFPGKPLATIHGMPMIGHCYHRTRLAPGVSMTYVATCDRAILDYINKIGGQAVMTSESHNRASTRTAEALEIIEQQTGERVDVVIMVQGDEPLIPPAMIGAVLNHFSDPNVEIVNLMSRFRTPESFYDKNNVKVVVDKFNNALYFSREPIPSAWKGWDHLPCYMQTGIIAFRRNSLLHFNSLNETALEVIESIDMNRVLENGGKIRMVPIEDLTIGVDTHEELIMAEKYLLTDASLTHYLKI
jgi:3-deoxy-manno-octulosonate cytidylyltransferase (CMP-KDO synthetase)